MVHKGKIKVFISTSGFAEYSLRPLDILKRKRIGFVLNPLKRKLSENEITKFLKAYPYAGLIAGTEPITGKVLREAGTLRVISRVGAGLDNIDLAAVGKRNIRVFNTPDVLVDSVAELTIGLIIDSLRKISLADRNMRSKGWKKEMGLLFKGKTLGIIGFGRIGRRVASLADAFGAKVIFHDLKKIKSSFARQLALGSLLKEADIVSLHTCGKATLITKQEIKRMKEGVLLINTSRGTAIDQEALYQGLESGKIASCALDVYQDEPYSGKLLNLDNCILTPHIGSYAKEARIKMEIEAVNNLIKGLRIP